MKTRWSRNRIRSQKKNRKLKLEAQVETIDVRLAPCISRQQRNLGLCLSIILPTRRAEQDHREVWLACWAKGFPVPNVVFAFVDIYSFCSAGSGKEMPVNILQSEKAESTGTQTDGVKGLPTQLIWGIVCSIKSSACGKLHSCVQ